MAGALYLRRATHQHCLWLAGSLTQLIALCFTAAAVLHCKILDALHSAK